MYACQLVPCQFLSRNSTVTRDTAIGILCVCPSVRHIIALRRNSCIMHPSSSLIRITVWYLLFSAESALQSWDGNTFNGDGKHKPATNNLRDMRSISPQITQTARYRPVATVDH